MGGSIWAFLVVGLIMGLWLALPFGGSGAFCFSRTLTAGRKAGLVASLGLASAGAFYAAIGGFQLTFLVSYFPDWITWLRGFGGLFFCYLGVITLLSSTRLLAFLSGREGLPGMYILLFLLTLASPLTVVPFTAIFPGFGLDKLIPGWSSAALLTLGVFLGANLWWIILSAVIRSFQINITASALKWVNRVLGIFIVLTGLVSMLSLIPML
jgi:threonine/homoserine/homoserine lactone efflux protein